MSMRSPSNLFQRSPSNFSASDGYFNASNELETPSRSGRRTTESAQSALKSPPMILNNGKRRESQIMRTPLARPNSIRSMHNELNTAASMGDLVEVPGNLVGVVKYLGPVEGRQGNFLGVDLNHQDAAKGRNNGTHDGIRYFDAKGPSSGLFVPQGRCLVLETASSRVTSEPARPSSRQLNNRPGSRMRSFSGRSFSAMTLLESSRPSTSETLSKGEQANHNAAAQQRLLNDNARLSKELESSQMYLIDLQKTNNIQAQEMEELVATLSELETLQGANRNEPDLSLELQELRAYLQDRERKIEELRNEAEVRRTEFKKVTDHQQATIDELKTFHQMQLTELQEKHDDIEERLNSAGDMMNHDTGHSQDQMETLQAQLLELSDELDVLVGQQERARLDIEIANSRIHELEAENARLLDELEISRVEVSKQTLPMTVDYEKKARRMTSIENLPDHHPQKRQTIEFLENEIRSLRETNDLQGSKLDELQATEALHITSEIETLRKTVASLQREQEGREPQDAMIQELRSALEREKSARKDLEEQHSRMEDTLEKTIMHIDSKSPRNSLQARSGKLNSRPSLAIDTSPTASQLDLRSPRPDRGPITQDLPSEGAVYCEFCEMEGHDIVSCSQVFGSNNASPERQRAPSPLQKHVRHEERDDDNETF